MLFSFLICIRVNSSAYTKLSDVQYINVLDSAYLSHMHVFRHLDQNESCCLHFWYIKIIIYRHKDEAETYKKDT